MAGGLSARMIGRRDEKHGADKTTRTKNDRGDTERPAQSTHQNKPAKLAANPPTNHQTAKVVSILRLRHGASFRLQGSTDRERQSL
jgi:hypothetical protein